MWTLAADKNEGREAKESRKIGSPRKESGNLVRQGGEMALSQVATSRRSPLYRWVLNVSTGRLNSTIEYFNYSTVWRFKHWIKLHQIYESILNAGTRCHSEVDGMPRDSKKKDPKPLIQWWRPKLDIQEAGSEESSLFGYSTHLLLGHWLTTSRNLRLSSTGNSKDTPEEL